jgi:hypothetical protein
LVAFSVTDPITIATGAQLDVTTHKERIADTTLEVTLRGYSSLSAL